MFTVTSSVRFTVVTTLGRFSADVATPRASSATDNGSIKFYQQRQVSWPVSSNSFRDLARAVCVRVRVCVCVWVCCVNAFVDACVCACVCTCVHVEEE